MTTKKLTYSIIHARLLVHLIRSRAIVFLCFEYSNHMLHSFISDVVQGLGLFTTEFSEMFM